MIDPEKLYNLIESAHISVAHLAEAIEVDPSTIYRWISKDRHHVSADHLRRLCTYFKCEPIEVIDVDLKEDVNEWEYET